MSVGSVRVDFSSNHSSSMAGHKSKNPAGASVDAACYPIGPSEVSAATERVSSMRHPETFDDGDPGRPGQEKERPA